jgi:HK97 family phage portal protein
MATKEITLYGPSGNLLTKDVPAGGVEIPDLDPTFFMSPSGSSVNTREVERKPYSLHWMVYACARVISWNLCRLPRVFEDKNNKKVEMNDLDDLFGRPNPFMTRRTFWEAVILNLLLPCREGFGRGQRGGQCFIVCDSGKEDYHVDLAKGEMPVAMYPYNDQYVSPEYDNSKHFIGWKFEIREQEILQHYAPHEIIRIYNFNPYDWLRGLSMYEPAQMAIINDIKADVWNSRTFDNDAIPAGVLTSDQELNEAQAIEIQNRWYQKYGFGNARRISVLGKGATFQKIQNDAKDMEFSQQKDRVVEEILGVFGLNKIAIGKYEELNYSTIVEGRKMLWEDTYIPIDESIMEQTNSQWIRNINPRNPIHMKADTSNIRVLKKDYSKQTIAAKTLYSMGVTAEVSCRINEIPLSDEDKSAMPWISEKPVAPIGGNSPFGGGNEGPTGVEPPPKSLITRVKWNVDALDKISESYIEKVLQPGENIMYNKLLRFFTSERNKLQDMVDEWLNKQKTKAKDTISADDFSLNRDEEDSYFIDKIYTPSVKEQLVREAAKLKEEIGPLVNWGVSDDMIQEFVDARAEGLKAINTTTINMYRDKISDAIADGYKNTFTPQQFAKAVKEAISDTGEIRKNQARTIARTETGIISSTARQEAFEDEGIKYKQWVTAGDEKVRESHVEENGNIVDVDEEFPVTGLMHPCDPDGEPEEVICCRCVEVSAESK